jgi:hypothetical protein
MTRRPRSAAPAARSGTPAPAAAGAAEVVPRSWSALAALTVFAVYLAQCPTVSGDKDSAEFTMVLALQGVSHPTGYPLFTLIGHLVVTLVHALGATWPYAANAWTALGGAVAIYLLHRLALSLLPTAPPEPQARLDDTRRTRFLLGLVPVALFAFNPIWTYEVTLAEVYSWHVAWVLGASLYFVRLATALAGEARWPSRRLYAHAAAWGLLCGVGGAHHATSIWVAAPLSIAIVVVLAARRRLRAGLVATVLLSTCVPLLSYGWIVWHASHPAVFQWSALEPGFRGAFAHITGEQYRAYLGRFAPSDEQRMFLAWYAYPFLVPALALLLFVAARARGLGGRAVHWGLAASALLGTAYVFEYSAYDPSSYFLHPIVLGLAALMPFLGGIAAMGGRGRRAALAGAVSLGLAGLVLSVPWIRTGQQRQRMYAAFDRLVHEMWLAVPADSGIVFWSNDMYAKLRQYQMLEGEKPGLTVAHGWIIYTPSVRRQFLQRYGFDPVAGITLTPHPRLTPAAMDSMQKEAADSVMARVNALTPLPVFRFDPDPARPSLRQLLKPSADSSARR